MISVCIFGSQARHTADLFSDRDMLVVGPASLVRDLMVMEWAKKAWDVAVLDRKAFARLAQVRSLFIQHLKQEGHILRDDENFLSATLEDYSPKKEYTGERNDALRQIRALPCSGGRMWFDLCLADIIYVLFRNAAVLHVASRGVYSFQYRELVSLMGDEFGLTSVEQAHLQLLRDLKHSYRRRLPNDEAGSSVVAARAAIENIARRIQDQSESSVSKGDTTDDYLSLRLLELDLVRRFDPCQLDLLKAEDELFSTWQRVISPGFYKKK